MSKVIPFLPKSSAMRHEALDLLVTYYRALMQKPFDNPTGHRQRPWIWGDFRWEGVGRFVKLENSSVSGAIKKLPAKMVLPTKTLEEIQSLIIHFVLLNPNKTSSATLSNLRRSLLAIEMTLRKKSKNGVADFSSLRVTDLDNAVQASMEAGKGRNPARLEVVQKLLIETGVVTSASVKQWVNSTARDVWTEYHAKSNSLAQENHQKLPNTEAVRAVANHFANQPWLTRGDDPNQFDDDQRNIVVSSVLALMSLTPCRIEELTKNLPVHCLVRKPESNVGEVLGISWYSDKTDLGGTKWVPYTQSGEFEEVVEEAVARLQYLTEDARKLLRSWDRECSEYDEAEYRKAKSENRLPKGWPYFEPDLKLRFSDALFVCLKHQMHPINHTVPNRIGWITKDNFKDWLRTRTGVNRWTGEPTIKRGFFDRIGCEGLALSPDDYNSHAFRHMVNTAARLGGMSEFDVNIWSHRKRQGEVYNHATGEQRRNLIVHGNHKAKELTPEERLDHIVHAMPMTRKNLGMHFELIGDNYGGFTFNHPLGTCIHNYVEGPCMRNMDCIMCPENAHCKGDKRTLKNLKEELEKSNTFFEMAVKEKDKRSAHKYEKRSEVLIALVDVLGDNSPLADGDLLVLSPQQATKAGLLERAKLTAEQIKKNQMEIESQHKEAKASIGVTRLLPQHQHTTSNNKGKMAQAIDAVENDFLGGFDDDED